jgi:hypothetical protein
MKYVAFIDSLGFKNTVKQINHNEAKIKIQQFNQQIYDLWSNLEFHTNDTIKGRTFSDSFIIHTQNKSSNQLSNLLTFLIKLYRISLTKFGFPLRGGIAVGEFDDLPAKEFDNLQKGLIIGNGFIEAYLLESSYSIKGSKIIFKQNVNLKIKQRLNDFITQKIKKTNNNEVLYELKWADLLYLTENNYSALNSFVDVATSSKWLNHYYGTLETFLIKESKDDKHEIYNRIVYRLLEKYKYNDLDTFIINFFNSQCSENFKRSFSSFIRRSLN